MSQIVSPVVIGRGAELAALEEALQAARQGLGRCILIAGEAGVGKSRLLLEGRRRALAEHFVVLQGNCFEQDLAYPYALWINALRSFLAWSGAPEAREQVGPLAAELVKLLPELPPTLPAVGIGAHVKPARVTVSHAAPSPRISFGGRRLSQYAANEGPANVARMKRGKGSHCGRWQTAGEASSDACLMPGESWVRVVEEEPPSGAA